MADYKNKQVFSNNLKKYLSKRGHVPTDLIDDLGIKKATVYAWLSGKTYPRIEKIELLADYFNISKSDLVEESNDEMTPKNIKQMPKVDLYKVNESERDELISANGQAISDEDWVVIKAILSKYPKKHEE